MIGMQLKKLGGLGVIGIASNNPAKLYGYPYFTFYLEEIFCANRDDHGIAQISKQISVGMKGGNGFVL